MRLKTFQKGKCVIAGNPPKSDKIKLNPYDFIFGKKIQGFVGDEISINKNLNLFTKIINFYSKFNLNKLFKSYEFKDINKAIKD